MTMKSIPCSGINPNWFFVLILSQFEAIELRSRALAHYSQRVQAKAKNFCATAVYIRALSEHTKCSVQTH